MCNFQYVLLVDSKDRAVVVYNFFLSLLFLDDGVVESDSKQNFFGRLLE